MESISAKRKKSFNLESSSSKRRKIRATTDEEEIEEPRPSTSRSAQAQLDIRFGFGARSWNQDLRMSDMMDEDQVQEFSRQHQYPVTQALPAAAEPDFFGGTSCTGGNEVNQNYQKAFADLPNELKTKILSYLTVREQMANRLVCGSWNELLLNRFQNQVTYVVDFSCRGENGLATLYKSNVNWKSIQFENVYLKALRNVPGAMTMKKTLRDGISALKLTNCEFNWTCFVKVVGLFPNLNELHLNHCGLVDVRNGTLKACRSPSTTNDQRTRLNSFNTEFQAMLKRLKILELECEEIGELEYILLKFEEHVKSLTTLTLSHEPESEVYKMLGIRPRSGFFDLLTRFIGNQHKTLTGLFVHFIGTTSWQSFQDFTIASLASTTFLQLKSFGYTEKPKKIVCSFTSDFETKILTETDMTLLNFAGSLKKLVDLNAFIKVYRYASPAYMDIISKLSTKLRYLYLSLITEIELLDNFPNVEQLELYCGEIRLSPPGTHPQRRRDDGLFLLSKPARFGQRFPQLKVLHLIYPRNTRAHGFVVDYLIQSVAENFQNLVSLIVDNCSELTNNAFIKCTRSYHNQQIQQQIDAHLLNSPETCLDSTIFCCESNHGDEEKGGDNPICLRLCSLKKLEELELGGNLKNVSAIAIREGFKFWRLKKLVIGGLRNMHPSTISLIARNNPALEHVKIGLKRVSLKEKDLSKEMSEVFQERLNFIQQRKLKFTSEMDSDDSFDSDY